MNALGRDIESGEAIVIHKRFFKEGFKDLAWRVHEAGGGFGAKSYTAGVFLAVTNLADGEHFGTSALNIDKKETEAFQRKYGKDGSKWPHKGWAKENPDAEPPTVDLSEG